MTYTSQICPCLELSISRQPLITLNYAERMRNLRQDNDLSQKKVADMLGVAQTTYSQYELEKRPMPIDYLIALCKFYNVSADYMLGLSNRKNP